LGLAGVGEVAAVDEPFLEVDGGGDLIAVGLADGRGEPVIEAGGHGCGLVHTPAVGDVDLVLFGAVVALNGRAERLNFTSEVVVVSGVGEGDGPKEVNGGGAVAGAEARGEV